jgi:hypothetical protein
MRAKNLALRLVVGSLLLPAISSKQAKPAILTFTFSDVSSGVLDITVQVDNIDIGSSMKKREVGGKGFLRRPAESDDHV